jgi:hypothetical protein
MCHVNPACLCAADKPGDRTILERIKDLQRPLNEDGDIDGADDVS